MRIALFADVHANLQALEACLAHAAGAGADRHVFLGDHVGYGGDPEAVVETLKDLVGRGAIAVLGNHDAAVAGELRQQMTGDAKTAIEWTRGRLDGGQREFLSSLPLSVEEEGRFYAHANGWAPADWEYVLGTREAERSLRATRSRLSAFGHIHRPMLYHRAETGLTQAFEPIPGAPVPLSATRRWLLLPGSAGQPRDGNPAACYAVLDETRKVVTFHRVPYDAESAARRIRDVGLPESLALRLEMGL
ncbi:MAG: metallophosphatase family protein [Acidobacteriota bacterium]|nr:metallophosphatase family protein [Acidobacteriota bacterium]